MPDVDDGALAIRRSYSGHRLEMSSQEAISGGTETVALPALPTSARRARVLTARLCAEAGLPQELVDTAVLLASETVTNAVVHGRSDVLLRIVAGSMGVRLEVGDDNSRHPVVKAHDADALDGRGVALLESCATSWGVLSERYGKVVWFEVRVAVDVGSACLC